MCGGNRDSGACTMLPEMQMATGAPLFPGESDIDQLFHIMRCFFGSLPERPMQHKNKRSSAQTNHVNFFFVVKFFFRLTLAVVGSLVMWGEPVCVPVRASPRPCRASARRFFFFV